jgi:hypothetical protein
MNEPGSRVTNGAGRDGPPGRGEGKGRWVMDLDNYIFPEEGRPRWFVAHSHSTGSSWDGTRRHSYRAVQLTRAVRAANVGRLYESRADAEAAAAEATERNDEP